MLAKRKRNKRKRNERKTKCVAALTARAERGPHRRAWAAIATALTQHSAHT